MRVVPIRFSPTQPVPDPATDPDLRKAIEETGIRLQAMIKAQELYRDLVGTALYGTFVTGGAA